jgi:hypothetical protein
MRILFLNLLDELDKNSRLTFRYIQRVVQTYLAQYPLQYFINTPGEDGKADRSGVAIKFEEMHENTHPFHTP